MDVTLRQYESAEKQVAAVDARRGMAIHTIITLIVCAALILVNVLVAPEFPWSVFAVAGMLIGVGAHYLFGVRRLGESVEAHQRKVESFASDAQAA
jgi:uncharacterized membrane protein YdbT with pleckstrin-like domain